MKKYIAPVFSLVMAAATAMAASPFIITRTVVNPPGQFLQSTPDTTLPEDMIVQGSEVHYEITPARGRSLNMDAFTFTFDFAQKQGDVAFQGPQGGTTNYFKADWYGENIVTITVESKKSGKKMTLKDRSMCHFAARQIFGGDGDKLTDAQRANIQRGRSHDITAEEKGMAFLPADITRGDPASEAIKKGFFETTEPRIFQTEKGTLIAAVQAHRTGRTGALTGQGIIVKRSTDHGATWTDDLLLDQGANDVWGRPAFVEIDGTTYCYATAGHPAHQDANKTIRGLFYYTSTDEGKTWSKRIRHDQLSAALELEPGKAIPDGISPNCNILKVPNMTLDRKTSPSGNGLLLSTYPNGNIWASIDDGKNWSLVADDEHYTDAKANGHKKSISIENELAWCVTDSREGDIYMVCSRPSSVGHKNEYFVSRHFLTGKSGMKVKDAYNQELKNVPARRCHFGMRKVLSGENKGKVILATQGLGSRTSVHLCVSKKAVAGQRIVANLFDEVTVLEGIGWGYCDLEYISAALPANKGMGQDGILLAGESEPIHTQTRQFIPLKPFGAGKNERYTTTAFMLSMDYFDFLKNR